MLIIAATGHRPDKLGGYGNSYAEARLARIALRFLQDEKPSIVVSGMALGWDQRVAEAALLAGIPLVAAIPFAGQELKWPEHAQARYRELLAQASRVVIVCSGGYAPQKMQVRNEYMVDRADALLAMWDGSSGGTANCIAYANQMRRPVHNLYPLFVE